MRACSATKRASKMPKPRVTSNSASKAQRWADPTEFNTTLAVRLKKTRENRKRGEGGEGAGRKGGPVKERIIKLTFAGAWEAA